MKTSKSLTEAEIDELPTLPDGWIWVRLGESIEVLTDGSHFSPRSIDKGYPYITVKDIKNDQIDFDNCSKISEDDYNNLVKSGCKPYKGDLLFSKDGTVGKVSLVSFEKDFVVLSSLAIIRPFTSINNSNSNFLFWVLKSNHFLNQALKSKKGVAIRRIILRDLKELIIPFPPLPEQRAIVSKIEQLFSELDNGIANLKLAQEQLKVYRQAVLKKAFEGELTKKWREQQTDLPNTQNLMKQIQREWGESIRASGKKTKAIKSLTEAELEELSLLPEGWGWVKLGQVVWSVKDGPHYSPKYEEKGIPFISGGNVRPSGVDFSNAKYISKELHEELSKRCKPELNDILYTKGGTTGIARVNTYDFDFNVWVHVAVLKTIKSIYPFYLQYVLNSSHCYRQSQKYTHGVGNQDLGLTRMILITLPICSLPEQQAIVQEIETRLSFCDKIEQDIETNLEKAEALRQSILKKAFEGKLLNEKELEEVRGAEDWEPAEVLLEKIKAENTKSNKNKE